MLALLGREGGVAFEQLLGVDEVDILGKHRLQLRKLDVEFVLGNLNRLVDASHGLFQKGYGALLGADDLLPIPLVDINRVEVVELLFGAQRIHVGVDASAGCGLQLGQLASFPLRQRVDHLGHLVVTVAHGKRYGSFRAVQVVVQTTAAQDDQRCSDTQQGQLSREVVLKHLLHLTNGTLGTFCVGNRVEVWRWKNQRHSLWVLVWMQMYDFSAEDTILR